MEKTHDNYMRKCLELAARPAGVVSPNPYVGCVIIDRFGEIISTGFHRGPYSDHAELDAIKKIESKELEGATVYTNLEPCCHTNKRTKPCLPLLLGKGVARVVIANRDPNPEVSGKSIEALKRDGIDVIEDVLKDEAEELNKEFFHHIIHKTPFVTLKIAQTLDGKIATNKMNSRWITSDKMRKRVHEVRNLHDGILVGRNTLNEDNPTLNVRYGISEKVPYRIILGNPDHINFETRVFNDPFIERTIIATNKDFKTGTPCEVVKFNTLTDLMEKLYQKGLASILVEGGKSVFSSFIQVGIYNEIINCISPKILGSGIDFVSLDEVGEIKESKKLTLKRVDKIDNEILMVSK